MAGTDDAGSWKANAYVVKSDLDLFNDFTYFLTNPIQGDQFHQHDDRVMSGGNASRTLNGSFAGRPMETTFGLQTRYDDIDLGLTDTFQRSFLSNVRSDKVGEASVGVYASNTVHWTDWLRTTVGWRGDYYAARVDSLFDANNSGNVSAGIGSPKFTMVVGPFNKTEFFLGAGYGMHSNDARGATITEDPVDRIQNPTAASTPIAASPLLVQTKGVEVGVRTKIVPGLDSSLSVFILDQASEIVFNGDAGDTSASRPSQRYGIEWTNKYQPVFLADARRRSRAVARAVCRVRQRAGRTLRVAGGLSAGADRQRARQLHPQCAGDGGLRRYHHRREDRLVRNTALALSRRKPADRRQCVPVISYQHLQRPHRLSV